MRQAKAALSDRDGEISALRLSAENAEKLLREAAAQVEGLKKTRLLLQEEILSSANKQKQREEAAQEVSSRMRVALPELTKRCAPIFKQLGTVGFPIPAFVEGQEAEIFAKVADGAVALLEGTALEMDSLVEDECQGLLRVAGTRVISNILRLHPGLSSEELLAPEETLDDEADEEIVRAAGERDALIAKYVEALADTFSRGTDAGETAAAPDQESCDASEAAAAGT